MNIILDILGKETYMMVCPIWEESLKGFVGNIIGIKFPNFPKRARTIIGIISGTVYGIWENNAYFNAGTDDVTMYWRWVLTFPMHILTAGISSTGLLGYVVSVGLHMIWNYVSLYVDPFQKLGYYSAILAIALIINFISLVRKK